MSKKKKMKDMTNVSHIAHLQDLFCFMQWWSSLSL